MGSMSTLPRADNAASRRSFLGLWIAGDLYALANWILLVVLLTWVYQQDELALHAGLLLAARLAPPLILGLVARPLVDRENSRMVAIAGHFLTALPLFSLLSIRPEGGLQMAILIALLAAIPIPFVRISHQEIMASLLDPAYRATAERALVGTRLITAVLGPAIAVLLLKSLAFTTGVWATIGILLLSTAAALLARPRTGKGAPPPPDPAEDPWSIQGLRRGIAGVAATRSLGALLFIRGITGLLAGGLLAGEVALVVWGLSTSAEHIGLLLAGQGLGVLFGSLAGPGIRKLASPSGLVAGGIGLVTAGVLGLAISTSLPAAAAMAVALGLGGAVLVTGTAASADLASPQGAGGPVAGVSEFMAEAMAVFSVLGTGLLVDALKPRFSLALAGILLAALALYAFGAVPDGRDTTSSPEDRHPADPPIPTGIRAGRQLDAE